MINAGLLGYVFKLAISKIAIERMMDRGLAFSARRLASIRQENIEQAIAIEVKECHSAVVVQFENFSLETGRLAMPHSGHAKEGASQAESQAEA